MATDKRARQRANRQQKFEQQVQEERRDKLRQYGFVGAIVAVVLVAAIGLFLIAGGDDDADTATDAADSQDAGADAGTDDAADDGTDDDATEDPSEPTEDPLPCPAEDGSSDPVLEFPAAPPDCLNEGSTYTAVFDTTAGEIVAELDPSKAPVTVNNFVYLARYHYYEGSTFHRVIQDFVIQGGDPTGEPPGTGGPGYTIDEEVPEPGEYTVGSLVMAKRTPPSTTGAQFFIVTGPDGEALPNQYSLFGQVTEGLDVADEIQSVETEAGDQPVDDVIINSITIVES